MAPASAQQRKQREAALLEAKNTVARAWEKERAKKTAAHKAAYDARRQAAMPELYKKRDTAVAFNVGLRAYIKEFFDAHGGKSLVKELKIERAFVCIPAEVDGTYVKQQTTEVKDDTFSLQIIAGAFENPAGRFKSDTHELYDKHHYAEVYYAEPYATHETYVKGAKIYMTRLDAALQTGQRREDVAVPTREEAEA